MDNLNKKYKKELFEYYKSKVILHDFKKENSFVKKFIKTNNISKKQQKLIKTFIETPVILHEIYEMHTGIYILKEYNKSEEEFNTLEELLYKIFEIDIKEKNPLYDIIEGSSEYYITDLKSEYKKYLTKKRIKEF